MDTNNNNIIIKVNIWKFRIFTLLHVLSPFLSREESLQDAVIMF